MNCHAMCAPCKRRHNEDPEPYRRFTRERYGAEVVAELEGLREGMGKVTDEELREASEQLRATGWNLRNNSGAQAGRRLERRRRRIQPYINLGAAHRRKL